MLELGSSKLSAHVQGRCPDERGWRGCECAAHTEEDKIRLQAGLNSHGERLAPALLDLSIREHARKEGQVVDGAVKVALGVALGLQPEPAVQTENQVAVLEKFSVARI